MRKSLKSNALFIVLTIFVAFITGCKENTAHTETYTCPMHPAVVSDAPGSCPVCGMELVKKTRHGKEVEITEDLSRLIKSPNESVLASIKTVKGEFKTIHIMTEAQGVVNYDVSNARIIASRVGGRLERVYLKAQFQRVRKGDRVAEIYSPELITAQHELIFLLDNDTENISLIQTAKQRLKQFGLHDAQIDEVVRTKKISNTSTLFSPYDGYVITNTQQPENTMQPSPTATSGGDMNAMSPASPATTSTDEPTLDEGLIREGTYVNPGQTLFKILNSRAKRIELRLPSSLSDRLTKNSKVTLYLGEQSVFRGKIDFIQPVSNSSGKFVEVIVSANGVDQLDNGRLVRAVIESDSVKALWVPKEAVTNLGISSVVFVKEKKAFLPRSVVTGAATDTHVAILRGLSSTEEIAYNGQYLVDSESFIKTGQ